MKKIDPAATEPFFQTLAANKQFSRNIALQQLTHVESPEVLAFAQDALVKFEANNPKDPERDYEVKAVQEKSRN